MLEFWKDKNYLQGTMDSYLTFTRKSGVYCIVNTINDKLYIGTCRNLRGRMGKYKGNFNIKGYKQVVLKSIIKYGMVNMEIYFLPYCNNTREEVELDYIDHVKKHYKVYNIADRHTKLRNGKQTKDSKKRISEAHSKAIYALDKNTGKILHEFKSLTEAAKFCNSSTSNISKSAKSDGTKSSKGYLWVYKDKYTGKEKFKKFKLKEKHLKFLKEKEMKPLKIIMKNGNVIYFKFIKDLYKYFKMGDTSLKRLIVSIKAGSSKKLSNVQDIIEITKEEYFKPKTK